MDTPTGNRKLFFGLFVFPLLIAVGMAILLCSVVLITHEEQTPETLVSTIKTGSASKRWQKAFELSNELNRSKDTLRDESLLKEMISIMNDSARYDSKTRGYMALAIGRFENEAAQEALVGALQSPDEDVQVYALWSLGNLNCVSAAPQVSKLLQSESAEIRKVSAYVLGAMGDRKYATNLRALLNDASMEVRWNAALGLARLGDAAGFEILSQMLKRENFSADLGMGEDSIESVMINAVKGLSLLGTPDSGRLLENVSKNEKNLKVRQAAMDALKLVSHKGGLVS